MQGICRYNIILYVGTVQYGMVQCKNIIIYDRTVGTLSYDDYVFCTHGDLPDLPHNINLHKFHRVNGSTTTIVPLIFIY